MYLQTSRLQYTLQGIGVSQTAHSDKIIQASACIFHYIHLLRKRKKKLLSPVKITCTRQSRYPGVKTGGDNRSCRFLPLLSGKILH